ncbi:Penicillopepsin-1 [Penicillium subrubescens]|uniref:penicillopepsin n=1 Tax=Penicillium subrubescens TaxID=1316194 RepID=A0A1Q5UH78_9EURO|nr:Penicillopepsin-1 [Penicillium subrubescens]KAJ5900443.1 Penicillopepsin-1 [Penicillium subrubescens]OKP11845.1 Penicillopepsin [Penicillium subrubescens]
MVVFSKITITLAGLASIASAAPAVKTNSKFSLKQVARPATKTTNFAAAYGHALSKYGATVPSHVEAAAVASGVATNTPVNGDEEYLTPVTIGGTTLNLDFDTGSADLWVFSTELSASEQSGHSVYDPSTSGTELSGYSWSISYGDGSSASGNVYTDAVTVGGITAPKQAVEAAQTISSQFQQDTNNDGLLGLAFSSINTVSPRAQTTFFDSVKSSLAQPLFAVALKHNAPGVYDFGFTDSSKYTGSIAYTSVDSSQGFWSFNVDSYKAGTRSGGGFSGIADTGTTLLLLPSTVVSAYYSQVSGAKNSRTAGGYVFDCSAKLPDFSVKIGSYTATVPGSLINYGPSGVGSTCLGGIQSNSGIGFSIFGDIFLKSQYVVFNSAGPKLGFAPQA